MFWLTNTGVSAARLYWENKLGCFVPKRVKVPVAASAFPDELYQAPESWARQAGRIPEDSVVVAVDVHSHDWKEPVKSASGVLSRASLASLGQRPAHISWPR